MKKIVSITIDEEINQSVNKKIKELNITKSMFIEETVKEKLNINKPFVDLRYKKQKNEKEFECKMDFRKKIEKQLFTWIFVDRFGKLNQQDTNILLEYIQTQKEEAKKLGLLVEIDWLLDIENKIKTKNYNDLPIHIEKNEMRILQSILYKRGCKSYEVNTIMNIINGKMKVKEKTYTDLEEIKR